jgi:hypothetical protein
VLVFLSALKEQPANGRVVGLSWGDWEQGVAGFRALAQCVTSKTVALTSLLFSWDTLGYSTLYCGSIYYIMLIFIVSMGRVLCLAVLSNYMFDRILLPRRFMTF